MLTAGPASASGRAGTSPGAAAPAAAEPLQRRACPTRTADPTVAGRWSALPPPEPESTVRAHFQAELLLNRYGVLTRGAVAAEGVPGGFATLYKVLTAFEDAGRCQRGYFVESLGARSSPWRRQSTGSGATRRGRSGAAGLPPSRWLPPTRPIRTVPRCRGRRAGEATARRRPGRKAGALVVLVDGELAWFLERGGRSLLSFTD